LESSLGGNKIGHADGASRIGAAAPFDPERQSAVAVPAARIRPLRPRDAERGPQPAVACKALDPAIGRPRHREIYIDAVGRGFGPPGAVAVDDPDIAGPGREGLSPLGQRTSELDRGDRAGWPDQLGRGRTVIAAGADMNVVLARLRTERLDELGVQRRAAVVDTALRVKGYDQLLIKK
jgi:hypothetical protein